MPREPRNTQGCESHSPDPDCLFPPLFDWSCASKWRGHAYRFPRYFWKGPWWITEKKPIIYSFSSEIKYIDTRETLPLAARWERCKGNDKSIDRKGEEGTNGQAYGLGTDFPALLHGSRQWKMIQNWIVKMYDCFRTCRPTSLFFIFSFLLRQGLLEPRQPSSA